MSKQWSRNHTYILIAIIIAAALIYGISYMSILKPTQDELNTLDQETSMYEKQYERITNPNVDDSSDTDLSNVSLQVPKAKSPDNVLVNLNDIASATDVTITQITSGTSQDGGNEEEAAGVFHKAVYAIEAHTNKLRRMNAFLDEIRDSKRLITIDTMDMYQSENNIEFSLTITTYYTKE